MIRTHLTVLEASACRYPSLPIFKVPQLDALSGTVNKWASISYQQFLRDVELYAQHWRRVLTHDGVPPKSVVGLWYAPRLMSPEYPSDFAHRRIGGFTYTDALHIYGVSRAGYIPQLFSLRLPNPVVVYELLRKANAKALIHDQTYAAHLSDCFLPVHQSSTMIVSEMDDEPLPPVSVPSPEDIAFIFHTSGSTSGSPKLIPCAFSWLDSAISKSYQISIPQTSERQDVTVWLGSMCHIAQTFKLVDMIYHAGLNRLNQFATFLSKHLKAARLDPKLLSLLQGLDDIIYTGLPLPREDEEWAYKNGLKLRNLFGSTECGALLLSIGPTERNPGLLSSLDGFNYRFLSSAPDAAVSHQSTARLMELIIPADSPDCPHPSLRHEDGDFHTGDLFQEVSPGLFVFRGRDDDWIKSENSLRCDTKYAH
ncbi:hypothetical protein C0992_010316 [Termitomyces sp. T32_za158]|nr:hypothetical protein C0992_010316 [Termitomyces sp. T32_za158]